MTANRSPVAGTHPSPLIHLLALRGLIVAGVLISVAATRAGGADAVVGIEIGIIGLGVLAAASPDTHLGLLVLLLAGVHWLVAVADLATPWAIGFASGAALAHTSMAAASVAPAAARWSGAMVRRWVGRLFVQISVIVPTWAAVAVLAGTDIAGYAVTMAAALLLIAAVGVWSRSGTLERDPPHTDRSPH
jgi:hypothetical protein